MRQLEPPDEEKLGYLFQEVTDDFLATNNEVIFDNSVVAAANTMPVEAGAGVLQALEAVKVRGCIAQPPHLCSSISNSKCFPCCWYICSYQKDAPRWWLSWKLPWDPFHLHTLISGVRRCMRFMLHFTC